MAIGDLVVSAVATATVASTWRQYWERGKPVSCPQSSYP